MENNNFVNGLFWNEKRPNSPDFVNGSISIKKDEFAEWLNNQSVSDKGYVNIELLTSKTWRQKIL